jgi:hypothetical protein
LQVYSVPTYRLKRSCRYIAALLQALLQVALLQVYRVPTYRLKRSCRYIVSLELLVCEALSY